MRFLTRLFKILFKYNFRYFNSIFEFFFFFFTRLCDIPLSSVIEEDLGRFLIMKLIFYGTFGCNFDGNWVEDVRKNGNNVLLLSIFFFFHLLIKKFVFFGFFSIRYELVLGTIPKEFEGFYSICKKFEVWIDNDSLELRICVNIMRTLVNCTRGYYF